jgi:hypothetical protein
MCAETVNSDSRSDRAVRIEVFSTDCVHTKNALFIAVDDLFPHIHSA